LLPNSPRLTTNNFDLLRLLFAGTVCLFHANELSGFKELEWISRFFSATVAVEAFFVVSGFLIFMSYERSSSVSSYAGKRIRRIYPAYFTVVMLCAIVLIGASSKEPGDYFSAAWVKYVLANLSFMNFLHPTLPGVFESNRYTAVNGALWTLKIEAMCYLSVPVFVCIFRRLGRLPVLAAVYALSVIYTTLCLLAAQRTGSAFYLHLSVQIPGQLAYFMAGAFFYYHLAFFERHARYLLAGAIAILAIDSVWSVPPLEPFALATVIVFFGLFLYAGNFGKYGDFSYGVYILHFPIVQVLVQSGWFEGRPWPFLIATILITAAGAIAMWHLVEKRFLLRSSHYVAATASAAATPSAAPGRRTN